jgi:trimethylamine--corrinoid protein Co-methyltransferase
MVMDDEIIGIVKRILRGIVVDDDTLAVDVIDHVGPGGHFLGEEHTVSRFRKEFWWPTVISRMRYDEWKTCGSKTLGQRVKEKTQRIIGEHRPEPLPQPILDQIQAVVDRAEAREAKLRSQK